MQHTTLKIQNLKCGGCANTIEKRLETFEKIQNVSIAVEASEISITHTDSLSLDEVRSALVKLGYPIDGDDNPTLTKAKSYVSCAIGRLS